MKEKIIEAYVQHCLENGCKPKNVYVFANSMGMEEKEFYTYFSSFESIENSLFEHWFLQVKERIEQAEVYASYSAREKYLSFCFAWVEQLSQHRSFVAMLYDQAKPHLSMPSVPGFIKSLKHVFIPFTKEILSGGMESKEIIDRKFLSDKYADALWLNLLFITHFWIKDQSAAFEKTDEAIEKSVHLAFDLLGHSPLDSILDFGKFLVQNK